MNKINECINVLSLLRLALSNISEESLRICRAMPAAEDRSQSCDDAEHNAAAVEAAINDVHSAIEHLRQVQMVESEVAKQ